MTKTQDRLTRGAMCTSSHRGYFYTATARDLPTMLRADAEGFPRLGLDDPSRHGFCPSYQAEGWTEQLGVLATRPP